MILTKCQPLQPKENHLHRPSLIRTLRIGIQHPLLLVQAGTGYGKSVELATFLHTHHAACCWLRLEESDRESQRFFQYLIQSLRTQFPSFGEEFTDLKPREPLPPDREDDVHNESVDPYCTAWINALAQLPEEVVLVLDDFHHVESVASIRQWLYGVLRYLPDHVHLVISSRTVLDWDLLAAMKVKGELQEITQADLAWTEAEVEVYLADICRIPVQEEHLQMIYRQTEGWAVAVQALAEQIMQKKDIASFSDAMTEVTKDLLRYLAIEVWDPQPESRKQLLNKLSVRKEWKPEWCREILGLPDPEQVLEELVHYNLFFWRSGTCYHFHPLFRMFILEQLEGQVEKISSFHQAAAQYFDRIGDEKEALWHLQEAGEEAMLAEFLSRCGLRIIEKGGLELLQRSISILSDQMKDRYCVVWIVEGEVNRYRSLQSGSSMLRTGGAVVPRSRGSPCRKYCS